MSNPPTIEGIGTSSGSDRDHRLVEVRAGTRSALRQLHGALRLRADRGAGHDGLTETVAARAVERVGRQDQGGRKWRARAGVTRPAAVAAGGQPGSGAGRPEVDDLRAKVAGPEAEIADRTPAS